MKLMLLILCIDLPLPRTSITLAGYLRESDQLAITFSSFLNLRQGFSITGVTTSAAGGTGTGALGFGVL